MYHYTTLELKSHVKTRLQNLCLLRNSWGGFHLENTFILVQWCGKFPLHDEFLFYQPLRPFVFKLWIILPDEFNTGCW